ncbi:MAG: prepilin-type N-terminal cleavage/methylation domain-containing protein [Deltaproteobacteria bacterium]
MRRNPQAAPARRKRGRAAPGFTLVELMVAMVGGLFVSMAVFAIAKHSSSFSMRQSRVADATLQNVVGFERLRADISRAGFLTTPNMANDPAVCRGVVYPTWLRRMAGIFIEPVPAPSTEITLNGFTPQRIVLSGSYASGNQFAVRAITPGPPVQVALQPDRLGMAEIGYTRAPVEATLSKVFATGRVLRLVDKTGRIQFAKIDGVTGGLNPSITLAVNPPLQFRSGSTVGCGIEGIGTGVVVNVVDIIRYDLRDLNVSTEPSFKPMFRGGPSYEATRRELVREELDLDGNPIANTLELISEYAVDLGFSLLVSQGTGGLQTIPPASVSDWAGTPGTLGVGQGPQHIRALRFWLSTRSQEADRDAAIPYTPAVPGPTRLRMSMNPTDPTLGPFARVRTLQTTVPLNNQATVLW